MDRYLDQLTEEKLSWNKSFLKRNFPGYRLPRDHFADVVEEFFQSGMIILDAGCGSRTVLGTYRGVASEVVGLDKEELGANVDKFIKADLNSPLPLADNSFDLVTLRWVLEHLKDPENTLKELVRILKPGGVIVAMTPNLLHPFYLGNRFLSFLLAERIRMFLASWFLKREGDDSLTPVYYHVNTIPKLKSLFGKVCLEKERFEMGTPPIGFFSRRLSAYSALIIEKIAEFFSCQWIRPILIVAYRKPK